MPEEPTTPDLTLLVQRLTDIGVTDIEAQMSFWVPDAVFDMSHGGLPLIEGREAIRAFFEEWSGAYDDYEKGPSSGPAATHPAVPETADTES